MVLIVLALVMDLLRAYFAHPKCLLVGMRKDELVNLENA